MDQTLRNAIGQLRDLLWLKTLERVEPADRTRIDGLISELLDPSFEHVSKLTIQLALDVQRAKERAVEDEATAARNIVEEAERAEKEAGQAEADAEQRKERLRLGVS